MSAAVVEREELLTLIPHQGTMCLWDRVEAWDATRLRLSTDSHLRADNPLRADGRLRAVHLCEYGAQAMAAHGGLLARAGGGAARPGMLVALRGVDLHVARVDDVPGPLHCDAELLAAGAGSQQYVFRIHGDGRLLAEGRAAVILQP
jgi:predicted hotdog family 3-hydroxylacyl-ACP dehydratase